MTLPIASPLYYLGGWAGNVTDDWGVDWVVQTEDGWSSSPPVRPTQTDKPQADGAWQGPGFYGARVINLKGTAIAADRASMLAAKRRIKAAVGPRDPIALQVAEADLTLTAQVRLSDQIDLVDKGSLGFTWSLTLVAADPRRYALDSFDGTTGLPPANIGRSYPRSYPRAYPYTPGGGMGSVFFTDVGDYDDTPATVIITGPVTSPQVTHVQSGRSMTLALTLNEGEFLVIDTAARTVLLNGTASRRSALTPDSAWWTMRPGFNEIRFRGVAGSSTTVPPTTPAMTVTAASAWA